MQIKSLTKPLKKCSECAGDGALRSKMGIIKCPKCNGEGVINEQKSN